MIAYARADAKSSSFTRRNVKREAWREFREAHSFQGNASEAMLAVDSDHPPSRFVAEELGFAWEHFPSIMLTLDRVDAINRANAKRADHEATQERRAAKAAAVKATKKARKVSRKRESTSARAARLDALAARAGLVEEVAWTRIVPLPARQ